MEDSAKFELTKSEAEQLSAMLNDVITAIDESLKRMAKDQEEIDQHRAAVREVLQRDWRGGINVEAILGPVSPSIDLGGNHRG